MKLGIYIHVPFCANICTYCDFAKIYYHKKYINSYLKSLRLEVEKRYQKEFVDSIYIGGGTPTCLDEEELEQLLKITDLFKKREKLEFTVESNIESLDEKKIELMQRYGVNRLSLGVQSFDEGCLKILGRRHTKEETIEVIKKIKDQGLININVDLIYGIIGDIEVVKRDLNIYLDLDLPHISCYSLIIEEGTILNNKGYSNIDEDQEFAMYEYISTKLREKGYNHYEVSNYAKPGFESIHNLNYWDNGYYYGFGLAAVSYIGGHRITNVRNLTKYLEGIYLEEDWEESVLEQIENTMILGLRKTQGINILDFQKKYGRELLEVYPSIRKLIEEEKLLLYQGYLKINPKYFYVSNEILINFIERSDSCDN